VRHLDESSSGSWKMRIADLDRYISGDWKNWQVKIYGHRNGAPINLNIEPTTFVAGQSATIDVSGGIPFEKVYMAYSLTGLGTQYVPQLGVTLGLDAPSVLGVPGYCDGMGVVGWSQYIPASATGRSYWLQSLQSGQISNIDAGVVQ
jgi:hypothetical protein